jgi:hypothetical protein
VAFRFGPLDLSLFASIGYGRNGAKVLHQILRKNLIKENRHTQASAFLNFHYREEMRPVLPVGAGHVD